MRLTCTTDYGTVIRSLLLRTLTMEVQCTKPSPGHRASSRSLGGDLYVLRDEALEPLRVLLKERGYVADPSASESKVEYWQKPRASRDGPIDLGLTIHHAWTWAPLQPSPTLHEQILAAVHMVSDCGYYNQDGRPWHDYHGPIERMRRFVEHCTTLNLRAWDQMIAHAPHDMPGLIRAIARFCHPHAIVEDRPNIGNVLATMGKMLDGDRPTRGEVAASARALADPRERAAWDEFTRWSVPRRARDR